MGSINTFIKECTKLFGKIEYKATSKDGVVFKSQGWKDLPTNLTEGDALTLPKPMPLVKSKRPKYASGR